MLRSLVYLILTIVVITLLRAFIGLIGKAVGQLFQPTAPSRNPPGGAAFGGELKKDPVCGVFVSAANALKKTSGGETVYFCSETCLNKFRGS